MQDSSQSRPTYKVLSFFSTPITAKRNIKIRDTLSIWDNLYFQRSKQKRRIYALGCHSGPQSSVKRSTITNQNTDLTTRPLKKANQNICEKRPLTFFQMAHKCKHSSFLYRWMNRKCFLKDSCERTVCLTKCWFRFTGHNEVRYT